MLKRQEREKVSHPLIIDVLVGLLFASCSGWRVQEQEYKGENIVISVHVCVEFQNKLNIASVTHYKSVTLPLFWFKVTYYSIASSFNFFFKLMVIFLHLKIGCESLEVEYEHTSCSWQEQKWQYYFSCTPWIWGKECRSDVLIVSKDLLFIIRSRNKWRRGNWPKLSPVSVGKKWRRDDGIRLANLYYDDDSDTKMCNSNEDDNWGLRGKDDVARNSSLEWAMMSRWWCSSFLPFLLSFFLSEFLYLKTKLFWWKEGGRNEDEQKDEHEDSKQVRRVRWSLQTTTLSCTQYHSGLLYLPLHCGPVFLNRGSSFCQ